MYKVRPKQILICALSSALPVLTAGTPAIGIAVSQGSIQVNGLQTPGNATVFDGNVVQTSGSPSQVRLKDGAQVRFAVDSRGTLFSDHVNLEKGSASISGYSANANGLSVRTDSKGSAVVTMQGKTVEIAAVTGNVHVFNAKGLNVANLVPGKALSLRPQDAGASAPSSLVGCAVKRGNDLILTDEISNVSVRVNGEGIRAGKRVQLTGAVLPNSSQEGDAVQAMKVTSTKEVGGTCSPAAMAASAGAVGAAGAATATTAAGAGTAAAGVGAASGIGTTTAVIGGVAAAATVGTVSSLAASSTTGGNGAASGSPNRCISPCTF